MKNLIVIVMVIVLHISMLQSQTFTRHYTPTANFVGNLQFTCLTEVSGSLLIAGCHNHSTAGSPSIYFLKANSTGGIIGDRLITFSGENYTTRIIPLGIMYDAGTGYVTFAGYIERGTTDVHAFVLQYNGASNLTWIKVLDEQSKFTDIDEDADGNFVVSGTIDYNDSPDYYTEAVLYSVNFTTGALNLISAIHDIPFLGGGTNAPDVYSSLLIDHSGDIVSTGRIEIDNLSQNTRPPIVETQPGGTINFANFYLKSAGIGGADAYLYGKDIVSKGSNHLTSIVEGDLTVDDLNVYRDLIVYRTDLSGVYDWGTHFDFDGDVDGELHSVKIYVPGGLALPAPIVYGSTYDNTGGQLSDAMLMRLDNVGGLTWCKSYSEIYAHDPSSPNSMIIVGTHIYAVGWFLESGLRVGALIRAGITDGNVSDDCQAELEPEEIPLEYEHELGYQEYEDDYNLEDPDFNVVNITATTDGICAEIERIGITDNILKEDIIVTSTDKATVEFAILNRNIDKEYSIAIYDIQGRLTREIAVEKDNISENNFVSGIYFYEFRSSGNVISSGKFNVK